MRSNYRFAERELTNAEYAQVVAGFDRHALEHGNPPESAERFTIVATEVGRLIGCASGLAYRSERGYGSWFYLSDLFVERDYRGQGIGGTILGMLEEKVQSVEMLFIWTWTAGYEAPGFYLRQGYSVFCELENWYPSGHSRVGFRKSLANRTTNRTQRQVSG